jgi:hypothetical protein
MVVEIAGQGSLGRNLSTSWNWNQVAPELRGRTGSAQVRRPFPQFGNVTEVKSQQGTTNFYGLVLRAEKRFSSGFSLLANYSWSKSVGRMEVEDSYNPQLSRGPTTYDEGNNPRGMPYHMGLLSGVYELPFGKGRRYLASGFASKILGGWDLGAIFSYQGGIPFSLSSGGDSLNCFCGSASRVNLVGDLRAGDRTIDRWFNTSAVAAPAFGTVGNLGQGILTSPNNKILNLSLGKDTPLPFREGMLLRLSAEVFNFTNTPQWGFPNTTRNSPAFGRITGPLGDFAGSPDISAGARIIQVGLRIEF